MNIAFFGGCLNRQRNLAADKHYHAIIRQHIINRNSPAPVIGLYFYSSYHQLLRKVETVLSGDVRYDFVVVFIRPYPLIPLIKLFIRYADQSRRTRLTLHPRFAWNPYYDLMIDENRIRPSESKHNLFHQTLQQLNDYAGDILNLPKWATDRDNDHLIQYTFYRGWKKCKADFHRAHFIPCY